MSPSSYYEAATIQTAVSEGRHREIIGGLWDEMGQRQLDFLIDRGLRPEHRLLDIGCGSLRLGARAIPYLEPHRYFGTDINEALVRAGHREELSPVSQACAPLSQFAFGPDFDFDFLPQPVDFAIAQSVFTHLPLNHLRRCLGRLAPHMVPGGRLFVTYFECVEGQELLGPIHQPPAGVVTHDHRDPYHYRLSDLEWAIDRAPWHFEPIGDWGHPRGQRMVAYERR